MKTVIIAAKQHFDFSRKSIFFKLIVFVVLGLLAIGYVHTFGEVYNYPAAGDYYTAQPSGTTDFIQEGDTLSQTFTSPFDTIRALSLYFDASATQRTVMYVVTLYENGEQIFVNDFKTDENPSPVNFLTYPIADAKGKTYTLEITVGRTTENSAAQFNTMPTCDFAESAQYNGESLAQPLALKINSEPTGQAATYTVVLVLFLALLAAVLFFLGKNIVLNTAVILLGFGIFIAVLNPLGDVSDEYAHFLRAEALADGKVFCTATTPVQSDAAMGDLMLRGDMQNNTFARFSDAQLYAAKAGGETISTAAGTAGNYFFLGYLASAPAIFFGKLTGMSAMRCLYLARILNVFWYAALCCGAVALSPLFKRTLSFAACFPLCVFMAASLSPDGTTIAFVLLSVAFFLYLFSMQKAALTLWHTLAWLALTLCGALTRIPYAVLLVLIFLIPADAYRRKNGKALMALQFSGIVLLAMVWTALSGYGGLRAVGGADAGAQISFMLQDLFRTANTVLGTMMEEIYVLYQQCFAFGWNTYNIAWLGVLLPFMLLHIVQSEKPLPTGGSKISHVAILCVLAIFAATYLGMYITSNPVGSGTVVGIQGRYFVEFLAFAPLLFATQACEKKIGRYTAHLYSLLMLVVGAATITLRHYM